MTRDGRVEAEVVEHARRVRNTEQRRSQGFDVTIKGDTPRARQLSFRATACYQPYQALAQKRITRRSDPGRLTALIRSRYAPAIVRSRRQSEALR